MKWEAKRTIVLPVVFLIMAIFAKAFYETEKSRLPESKDETVLAGETWSGTCEGSLWIIQPIGSNTGSPDGRVQPYVVLNEGNPLKKNGMRISHYPIGIHRSGCVKVNTVLNKDQLYFTLEIITQK